MKENVNISNSAKLQNSKAKTCKMVDEKKRQTYGGLTAIHLSLICDPVRLGWTNCHTFVSYLYDSKAWVD